MNIKCNECNEMEDLIKFKFNNTYLYICKRCWDAKVDKGNKNHVSIETYRKHFVPSRKAGRK